MFSLNFYFMLVSSIKNKKEKIKIFDQITKLQCHQHLILKNDTFLHTDRLNSVYSTNIRRYMSKKLKIYKEKYNNYRELLT